MESNRQSYPDVAVSYDGSMSSRTALIEPVGDHWYALYDQWVVTALGARSAPCVGFIRTEALAPIIFGDWRRMSKVDKSLPYPWGVLQTEGIAW